jgi:hypothetical protein
MILLLLLIVIVICMCKYNNVDNFSNCGPSAPNVKPPEWYIPQTVLNYKNWETPMYTSLGHLNTDRDSLAYRFWQF